MPHPSLRTINNLDLTFTFSSIQNFTEYVGTKSTFRLLNRGSAKALDKVAELYGTKIYILFTVKAYILCNLTNDLKPTDKGKEVLIIKTTIHDIMNKMIRVCMLPSFCTKYLILSN